MYIEVVLVACGEDREALIGLLYLYGIESLWIEEDRGKVFVRFYLEQENFETLSLLEPALKKSFKSLSIECREFDREDWNSLWKKDYAPVEIDGVLEIVPPWFDKSDRSILIKPGMAFGTGYHPTTYLSAKKLVKYVPSGFHVLDIGTGSGVLSIVAAFLGAKSIGVDIDPTAVVEAQKNAVLNNVEEKCTFIVGDLLSAISFEFDVVVANILTPVIIVMLEDVRKNLRRGGYFIASGITMDERKRVAEALIEHGFRIVEVDSKGEWVVFVSTT